MIDRLLVEPFLQFVPEPLVRPLLDPVVERTLHVIAAAVHRAHGAECKAARMVGIDQLVRDWWRLRKNSEPAERIHPLKRLDRLGLDADTADAVKAVTA